MTKEKAIEIIERYKISDPASLYELDTNLACDMAIKALKEIDSLKAEQERSKHGHWIVLWDCSNSGVYCSECMNKMFDRYPMKKKFSQYCGHCGAHNDLPIEVR